MALAAVRPEMPPQSKKDIHPFFSKQPREPSPDPPQNTHTDDNPDDSDFEHSTEAKGRKKRARKAEGPRQKKDTLLITKGQPSLDRFARRPNGRIDDSAPCVRAVSPKEDKAGQATLEEDPNLRRSKRRRTDSPVPVYTNPNVEVESIPEAGGLDWRGQLQIEARKDAVQHGPTGHAASAGPPPMTEEPSTEPGPKSIQPEPETTIAPSGRPQEAPEPGEKTTKPATPKKKVLRVSKSGKLLSPSPSKTLSNPEVDISTSPKKKRGRKPKAKASLIVAIKYGSDVGSRQRIGQKIEDILSGGVVPAARLVTPKKAPSRPAGPPKPPHPFFTGPPKPPKPAHPFFVGKASRKEEVTAAEQPVKAPAALPPTSAKKTTVTPGKLRAESRSHQPSLPMPAFGSASGANRAAKLPGTIEAPWPTRDSSHVRNIDEGDLSAMLSSMRTENGLLKPRKLKRNPVSVPQNEDIVCRLAKELDTTADINDDDASVESRRNGAIRLPTRLLTTSVDIQGRLCKEVKALLSTSGDKKGVHPAVAAIFKDIEHDLTPFDKGECESQAWVQKYAPVSTAQVLQAGKEALVLRDWLQNLTVMAVQGSKEKTTSTTITDPKGPPKKKRKKMEDDFIVSDDDFGDDEMIDISGGEEYDETESRKRRQRSEKSTRMTRNKNVIVLSGPHGCGKSAAVYAVAKELGFEVFEINSSTRRSAKDIQDKVGDMSENHLVHHHRTEAKDSQDTSAAKEIDHDHMDQAFQNDLDSGRQGTMISFFQSKPSKAAIPGPKPKAKEAEKPKPVAQATLPQAQKPRRQQKQSLILFEEADVLFEQDQQFWAQVTKLAFQSKRPIVITCNNENLLQPNLPLAAILRFTPPPVAIATDYLLTLAAKEGHILKRKAVCDLYESRNRDLRASITELNLWCQMSVGDRKGGLEWIYQRWPPGKDVDEKGRVLRVASEDTYQSGMGLTSHDVMSATSNTAFDKEESLLRNVWADWGVSPAMWNRHNKLSDDQPLKPTGSTLSLNDLTRLDDMMDAVSSADVYCRIGLPTYDRFCEEPTDPSLPPMPDKERLNYTTEGRPLQVGHVVDFSGFDTDMAIRSHLSVQRAFGDKSLLRDHHQSPNMPARTTELILEHRPNRRKDDALSRPDFSEAFDILAYPPDTSPSLASTYPLSITTFDRPFNVVVEDVAPFVRSIVAHEQRLEAQRLRISNLLSQGGSSKRPRTTRASRVAEEGGTRQSKRRERWFDKHLNYTLVMATAGQSWSGLGVGSEGDGTEVSSVTGGSLPGTLED